jgi:hypothetical protein
MIEVDCRFCHDSTNTFMDPLISPCNCKGTLKFVHRKCLEDWESRNNSNNICNECETSYSRNIIFDGLCDFSFLRNTYIQYLNAGLKLGLILLYPIIYILNYIFTILFEEITFYNLFIYYLFKYSLFFISGIITSYRNNIQVYIKDMMLLSIIMNGGYLYLHLNEKSPSLYFLIFTISVETINYIFELLVSYSNSHRKILYINKK